MINSLKGLSIDYKLSSQYNSPMAMAVESGSLQLDFGLNTSNVVIRPVAELRHRFTSRRALAELISYQHLIDREQSYFGPDSPGRATDRMWEAVARRNPKYTDRVFKIQDAMRDARRETAEAPNRSRYNSFYESIVTNWYDHVENPGTRAVLTDLLRLTDAWGVDTYLYSRKIEKVIADQFPGALDEDGWATFDGVTPGDLFDLMLQGTIKLPSFDPREMWEWNL